MELSRILHKNKLAVEQIIEKRPEGSKSGNLVWLSSSHSWLIIFLGTFLIGSLWFFVHYQINADYDRTIDENSRETMNLSIAFEEHVRRIVSSVDNDLLNIKQAYERDSISSPIFVANAQTTLGNPARNLVAVFDEQGVIVQSSTVNALGANSADMEYFQFHRRADTQNMYIGLVSERNIPLTRRINKPDGSFGGIVYISLKADYFNSFYKKMDLGQNQLIALIGMDWFVRARQTGDNMEIGQDVHGSQGWRTVQTGSTAGTYITNDAVDGINRIVSYRVMPDYPLVLFVAKTTQVALAAFEKRKHGYILGALLATLFILGFCAFLVGRSKKEKALNIELERRVDERTQKLTAMFESLSDPFYVLDKEWRLTYINKEATQVDIILSEAHIGQNIWEVSPELAGGELYLKCHEACTTNIPIHIIFKSISHEKMYDAHLYPYAEGLFVYLRDVTEQMKYEADILRLDRLNLIGEMAASIAHEVRNPMTTVRGYLQWLLPKSAFIDYREPLALMIEEVDRANAIITEFLSLAKNKPFKLILIDLNMVIRSIFPLLQADAFRRGNIIELELQEISKVFLDEKEMRQCILNLVCNGMDAMVKGGKVTISTAKVGKQVVMTVRDGGPGISPEIKAKLGTPFFSTKEGGTGLGLSVCYRIAQRHEAIIEVETGHEGTAFHFIFSQKGIEG